MSLPRYPAYKDSGVSWLGDVPAHWDVTRLKFVAKVQTGIAKGKDVTDKETITVPYLRVANVQDGYLALEDTAMIEIEPEQLARYRLQVGDVLMNEGGDFDKLGRGAIWQGEISDCIHQNHVFAVRPHSISSDWLNQLTSSGYAQFYFMTRSKQSTNLASISSSNIMEMPVLMPPLEEQRAILTILDRETAKIDALITEQEKLIALLAEKRQATISRAVTCGLDPNVPLKDSGVPWLGMVPAPWEVKRFRDVCLSISTGPFGTALGAADYISGGVPVINPSHIINSKIVPDDDVTVSVSTAERLSYWIVRSGEIVVARRGELGRAAVVDASSNGWVCGTGSLRVTPNVGHATAYFLHATLQSKYAREWLNQESVGSTMANLNEGILGNLPIVVPPNTAEQTRLTEELSRKLHNIELMISLAEQNIALSQERRTALISAAVTGKIDVRGLAA